jgi:hypothetical protein
MDHGERIPDHRTLFTREEFIEAFRIAGASKEAAEEHTAAILEMEGDGYGISKHRWFGQSLKCRP